MKYIDIYNNIKNPLENPDILNEIIKAYKDRIKHPRFYDSILRTTKKDNEDIVFSEEYNKFYVNAFNKWKKGFLSLKQEEIEELKARKLLDDKVFKMIEFLKTVPDVKTEEEASNIFNKIYNDKELESAIQVYKWNSLGYYSGFIHVDSRCFDGRRGPKSIIDHRLYLNTEDIDTYTIANEFIRKCDEREIPYYFKFDFGDSHDDNIVVYSNTERLPLYIEVLREIAEENPQIRQRCHRPPILTGQIDGWIGYGAEPSPKYGKKRSFNGVRSKCIEMAIESSMDDWIRANKDKSVNYQGKNISMVDYLTLLGTNYELESMHKRLDSMKNKTQKELEAAAGYDKNYIENPTFINRLSKEIRTKIQEHLDNVEDIKEIEIPLKNYHYKIVPLKHIKSYQDVFLEDLMKNDSKFYKNVLENINKFSEAENIDITKYCFDKDTKEKFIKQDKDTATVEACYEEIKRNLEAASKKAPRRKNKNESNLQYLESLKEYCRIIDSKEKETVSQPKQQPVNTQLTYHLSKDKIIQDLPIYSKQESRYNGVMSDAEIKASQKKLGTYPTRNKKA